MGDRHLIGYSDKFSIEAGNDLGFMVSTTERSFTVDIVKLSLGEGQNGNPEIIEEQVPVNAPGRVAGREQTTNPGSFVYVPDFGRALAALGAWCVQLWAQPTLSADRGDQVLISTLSTVTGRGWELLLNDRARLVLRVAGDRGSYRLEMREPLQRNRWCEILAGYDKGSGQIVLGVRERSQDAMIVQRIDKHPGSLEGLSSDLMMGARWTGMARSGRPSAEAHFNGRMEDVRIYAAAPNPILAKSRDGDGDTRDRLLSRWDFAGDMSDAHIPDRGPLGRNGVAVNMPGRAVAGHEWDGRYLDFRQNRRHYAAIHLHEDDLEDADWDKSFTISIPNHLRSGVYAARCVSADFVEHIPFAVTPRRSQPSAKVAVVLPLYTYMAYANLQAVLDPEFELSGNNERELIDDPYLDVLRRHPEWGGSLYDVHPDGSGCMYASWQRPLLNMRPGYVSRASGGPREFSADLCLLHWLDQAGIDVDVLTDHELHHGGVDAIAPYRVVMTGSHPEYCTSGMRAGLDAYVKQGGRLMYLGGNGFYWVTSVHPRFSDIIEVRRGHSGTRAWNSRSGEVYHSTTGEPGGLWRHRGQAPNDLVGVGFTGLGWDDHAGYYERLPLSYEPEYRWIFDGTENGEPIGAFGLAMSGAAGDELDRHDPALGGSDAVVLARSAGHSDHYCVAVEELTQTTPDVTASKSELVRADMTYMPTEDGGCVFSVGSMCWIPALPVNGGKNNVSQITENVLRGFLSEAALVRTSY